MIMPPRVRKAVLTAHVVSSVGWLGAVVAFVGIAFVALTSQDAQAVRGALLVMEPIGWYVLVPLVFASLLTGIIQALGTTWGLIRHYWVLFKLVIAAVSSVVLLAFMEGTLSPVVGVAADPASSVDQLRALAATPRDHALLALSGLLLATVLALYKPRAMTPYGQRKQADQRSKQADRRAMAMAAATPPEQPRSGGHLADRPGSPETDHRTDVVPDRRPTGGLPGWVKVAAFIVAVLIWAIATKLVIAGGPQGGGHGSGSDTPGVNQEQRPGTNQEQQVDPGGGGHVPPPSIPDHGG